MMRKIARAQAIGCGVGSVEGLMPGAGGTLASFIAYNEAKRWSKEPEKFGKGSEEGVAAPETANNTVASTALIPLLSFGIPGSNSAAVLLGGLLIHGLRAGSAPVRRKSRSRDRPLCRLVRRRHRADLGRHADPSGLPLAREPAEALPLGLHFRAHHVGRVHGPHVAVRSRHRHDGGACSAISCAISDFPVLPAVLGVVLGNLVESNYRRSLALSGGEFSIFLEDPIAIVFLVLAVLIVTASLLNEWRVAAKARKERTA